MKKVQDPALSMRARMVGSARTRCRASRVCAAFISPATRKRAILYLGLLVAVAALLIWAVYLVGSVLSHPESISLPNFSMMV